MQYVGRIYANDRNTAFAPSYTIGNAWIGFAQSTGKVKFTEYVRVNNIANVNYIGSVIVGDTNQPLLRAGAGTQLVRGGERGRVVLGLPWGWRRSILAPPQFDQRPSRRQNGRQPEEILVSVQLSLTVNGKAVKADVDERTLLVEYLRNQLALTGTHVGCDTGQCGACTVLVDGRAVKSCNMLAAQANGGKVQTIEGLAAADGTLHPMQAAFKECHGLQCGFCTPGMVMSALDLVARHPNADEKTIREELEGNLCRCTGYQNIVRAVQTGAAAMAK